MCRCTELICVRRSRCTWTANIATAYGSKHSSVNLRGRRYQGLTAVPTRLIIRRLSRPRNGSLNLSNPSATSPRTCGLRPSSLCQSRCRGIARRRAAAVGVISRSPDPDATRSREATRRSYDHLTPNDRHRW